MVLDRAVAGRCRRLFVAFAIALVAALGAAAASAELVQHGNLFIRFDGDISPHALPRQEQAPISVRIEGTVRVPSGKEPPSLRRVTIALNRAGHLNSRGLPICHRNRIDPATPSEALAACGSSLVGAGGIVARTAIADQAPTTVRADILLFNSIENGRPAVLGHVYQTEPTPINRIIAFEIRRKSGTFGTVIVGHLPPGLNRNGHLKSIFLQLERRYVFRGQPRSYLSAACSAPPGFSGAPFPFARASMAFDDGRKLSSVLVRTCRVK